MKITDSKLIYFELNLIILSILFEEIAGSVIAVHKGFSED
jgi:hypothetical protein